MDLPVGIDRQIQTALEDLQSQIDAMRQPQAYDMQGRSIINVRAAVQPTDAVNLAQVQKEIHALRRETASALEQLKRRT